jgi:hypothetical protein
MKLTCATDITFNWRYGRDIKWKEALYDRMSIFVDFFNDDFSH